MNWLWVSCVWIVGNTPTTRAAPFHPQSRTRRPQLFPARNVLQQCAASEDFKLSRDSGLLY